MAFDKNISLQIKIQSKVTDLFKKESTDNIIVDVTTGETLTDRLEYLAALTGASESALRKAAKEAIKEVLEEEDDKLDSLDSIISYIQEDKEDKESLWNALQNLVEKEEGKGLSTNDFTDEFKEQLESLISAHINGVSKSDINGNIRINDEEVRVYTHPVSDGNMHIPAGGKDGQFLIYAGKDGTAEWHDLGISVYVVEDKDNTPSTLKEKDIVLRLE